MGKPSIEGEGCDGVSPHLRGTKSSRRPCQNAQTGSTSRICWRTSNNQRTWSSGESPLLLATLQFNLFVYEQTRSP